MISGKLDKYAMRQIPIRIKTAYEALFAKKKIPKTGVLCDSDMLMSESIPIQCVCRALNRFRIICEAVQGQGLGFTEDIYTNDAKEFYL